MKSIYVPLPEAATERLRELARRELRDTKSQASYLILDGLRRAGLDPERATELSAADRDSPAPGQR